MVWITDFSVREDLYSDLKIPKFSNYHCVGYLYWYENPKYPNNIKEGYVGITADIIRRDLEHRSGGTSGKHSHISYGLRKYPDLPVTILAVGPLTSCAKVERYLRPIKNKGWNHAIGGGYPPRPSKEDYIKWARNYLKEKSIFLPFMKCLLTRSFNSKVEL